MSAVGKVVELDASGLDVLAENPKYPGLCTITLTCTLSQSREWAQLFGETVRVEPLIGATPACGCAETYPQLTDGTVSHAPECPNREQPQQSLPGVSP